MREVSAAQAADGRWTSPIFGRPAALLDAAAEAAGPGGEFVQDGGVAVAVQERHAVRHRRRPPVNKLRGLPGQVRRSGCRPAR
ncbi:hypothetical protein [Streptomyces sp. NBC_01451]|uniref:hypothetical protein n=1 Tax=Streptomyces sp. NBC_01451 TaxID=2903872 RepID=UPI002E2FCC43|nr:hypothetical protein [Streptomyces sp. NBC_01451]